MSETSGEDPVAASPDRARRRPAAGVTWAILAANVAVFGWMLLGGVPLLAPSAEDLLGFGADHPPLVVTGEWWRLFTCMFVHAGVIHIGFNMWALRVFGPPVEGLFGHAAFAILYSLSGVGASIASCLWHPAGVSVGASGAIFGLPGALVAFSLMHKRELAPDLFRAQMRSMATFLGINVLIGLSIPQIDLSGHVGGLVTGFACGLAACRKSWSPAAITRRELARLAAVAAILAASTALIRPRVLHDADAARQYWTIRGERALGARAIEDLRSIGQAVVAADPAWSYGYLARANAALLSSDWDAALPDLDRALELEPANAHAWTTRAWLRDQRGDHAGALEDLDRSVEIDALDGPMLAFRGELQCKLGRWAPALRDFEAVIGMGGKQAAEAELQAWSCRAHLGLAGSATRELEAALAAGRLGSGWERETALFLTGQIANAEFERRMQAGASREKALLWSREKSDALAADASAR